MIDVIAFDADDTLWHTETLFQASQKRLAEILDHYAPHDHVQNHLQEIEHKNLQVFGYGVKGFTLSMVEAAIEISAGRISAEDIHRIVGMGKAMLLEPMDLMDDVDDVLTELRQRYRLLLITKGDPIDQNNKISNSGLAHHFEVTEVVPEKDVSTYDALFARHSVEASRMMMVGNSLPSDILPVLELGGFAVHVPYHVTSTFEQHSGSVEHERLHTLERLAQLPGLLQRLWKS